MRQSSGATFFRSFSDTVARAFRWQRTNKTDTQALDNTAERIPIAKAVLSAPRPWLRDLRWEKIESINQSQCQLQSTQPTPNRDSYESVRQSWDAACGQPMSLLKALDLCKESHDKGPFVFSNSSTFCLVAKGMVEDLVGNLPPVEAHIVRGTVANYVSGRIRKRELLDILRIYESKWSLLANVSGNGQHIETRSVA